MTTDEILRKLSAGNLRFIADRLQGELQIKISSESLVNVQKPFAIVLSCADSRVIPELIFETGFGELFVVRVAGNIANTSSVASIEYAVSHLETKVIVVLGHQSCGAVTAAINGGDNGENINQLLSFISPAIAASAKLASVDEVVKKNAELTAGELINESEIIKNAVEKDGVRIVSAYYNLDSGKVDFLF
jgi:carbonic anhydrase